MCNSSQMYSMSEFFNPKSVCVLTNIFAGYGLDIYGQIQSLHVVFIKKSVYGFSHWIKGLLCDMHYFNIQKFIVTLHFEWAWSFIE